MRRFWFGDPIQPGKEFVKQSGAEKFGILGKLQPFDYIRRNASGFEDLDLTFDPRRIRWRVTG